MCAKLTLIRGLPGSGKSTYARELQEADLTRNTAWFEADAFFMEGMPSKYVFKPRLLGRAHEWCKANTKAALEADMNVIVSNTLVTRKELKVYIKLAKAVGAEWEIVECFGDFGNVHGASVELIDNMRRKWEDCSVLRHPNDKVPKFPNGLPWDYTSESFL